MNKKIGKIHTILTRRIGFPFFGEPVNAYISDSPKTPENTCYVPYTPQELGLPESHSTMTRKRGRQTYQAAIFSLRIIIALDELSIEDFLLKYPNDLK